MENLQKFVNKQSQCTNLVHCDTFNDELEQHFLCEFLLNESFKYSYMHIYEKYGMYIGQNELIFYLAQTIYKKIKTNKQMFILTLNSKDLTKYNNIFFDNITIKVNTTQNSSGYYPKKSIYNENNRFTNVVIYLRDYDCTEYTNICRCLMHELLHAYNNYQSYATNAVNTLLDITKKDSQYNKTLSDSQNVSPSNICKRIINIIRKFEQNAHISELSIMLDSYNFDISKYYDIMDAYKNAVKIFKSSDVYKQYSILYQYVEYMDNENIMEQKQFADTYNNINSTNLSYHKISKRLKTKINMVLKRMESIVPKIFYEYYQKQLNITNESLINNTSALIDFIAYMNKF